MEPVSSREQSRSDDPTPAELEAGACLPREPEPLESRPKAAPAPLAPAVQALVDNHPSPASAAPPPSNAGGSAGKSAHHGIALSVGLNFASSGSRVGHEASLGVVLDFSEPQLTVFSSTGSGKAAASGLSAGISGQASLVMDVRKFYGSGEELGVNLPRVGVAANFTSAAPGGPIELNGLTISGGASIGSDGHYFETTTQSLTWQDIKDAATQGVRDIKDALHRAANLPGPHRFGP